MAISKYISTGDVESARQLFDNMPKRDAMRCHFLDLNDFGLYQNWDVPKARDLFEQIPENEFGDLDFDDWGL